MELVDISDEYKVTDVTLNKHLDEVKNEFGEDKVIHIPDAYLIPQLGALKWDGHIYVSGATGAGKSYIIKQIVAHDKKRRKVYLFSTVNDDPSLRELSMHQYNEGDSLDDCICIFDDFPDRTLRDVILETGRHSNTVCIVVNHKHREWLQTMKPINESKYVILFPSANRGVVLNEMKQLGLTRKQRSLIVSLSQEDGRYLILHQHAPNTIVTQKTVVQL